MRFLTAGECMTILAITKNTIKGTGYDILTNGFIFFLLPCRCFVLHLIVLSHCVAIWPEVADAIKNLAPIFNAGHPELFHKVPLLLLLSLIVLNSVQTSNFLSFQNYLLTMEFVQEFEKQSASRKTLLNLRASKPYVDFMQRWQQRQLPIYYQIRFKEISSSIEDVLSDANLLGTVNPDLSTFLLKSAAIIFSSMQRCWAPEIFLYGLVHRFWKLTLQVLSFLLSFFQKENRPERHLFHPLKLLARYDAWLQSVLPEKAATLEDDIAEKVHNNQNRKEHY